MLTTRMLMMLMLPCSVGLRLDVLPATLLLTSATTAYVSSLLLDWLESTYCNQT
jgi:hypothetical protein